MTTKATETRRRNRRNASIVAFLEALPIGSHGLYVDGAFEPALKPEGGLSLLTEKTRITIAPTRTPA